MWLAERFEKGPLCCCGAGRPGRAGKPHGADPSASASQAPGFQSPKLGGGDVSAWSADSLEATHGASTVQDAVTGMPYRVARHRTLLRQRAACIRSDGTAQSSVSVKVCPKLKGGQAGPLQPPVAVPLCRNLSLALAVAAHACLSAIWPGRDPATLVLQPQNFTGPTLAVLAAPGCAPCHGISPEGLNLRPQTLHPASAPAWARA